MSDFSQRGLISTLQLLGDGEARHAPDAGAIAKSVTVVIPCGPADANAPALRRMLSQLADTPFIQRILLVSNHASAPIGDLPAKCIALRTDRPGALPWLPQGVPGKSLNIWTAIGWLAREDPEGFLVLHDADVTTFDRSYLLRLAASVGNPEIGYRFSKLYYSRVAGQIYGRLTRLFFFPLLQALTRTLGHMPLLDYLASFRYPLAGECAMPVSLAASLPITSTWGIETGMLCEVFRRTDPRDICQVEAGVTYDHKHQEIGDANQGLCRMAREIAQTLYQNLAKEGVETSPALQRAVFDSFTRETNEAVRRYRNLALINGLAYHTDLEIGTAHAFGAMLEAPIDLPGEDLPAWSSLPGANHRAAHDFLAATRELP